MLSLHQICYVFFYSFELGFLDPPFGVKSKVESLATSVRIALILALYCNGEAEFQCQLVPVEAVTLCFGSKMHVLNKQGDVHFAKGSVVY